MIQEISDIKNASDLLNFAAFQGLEIKAPVDIEGIIGALDIEIKHDFLLENDDVIGRIEFVNDKAVISINPQQNRYLPRRRFTLAHELGHYFLHSSKTKKSFTDSMKTMSRTESYWDSYESEANTFAAQLLMPKDLILTEGESIVGAYKAENRTDTMPISIFIEKMARKFEVSYKAMEYRLKNLSII